MPNKNHVQNVVVRLDARTLQVQLSDGRDMTMPLDWFPRLSRPIITDRQSYEIVKDGESLTPPPSRKPTPMRATRVITPARGVA